MNWSLRIGLVGVFAWHSYAAASTLTPTSNFTEMLGGAWGSHPGFRILQPLQIGGVILSYQATMAPVVYSTIGIHDAENPNTGLGIGFYKSPGSPYDGTPAIINFSTPISGFGATFLHSDLVFGLLGEASRMPARIEVFSLPSGQGELLGSIDSRGFVVTVPGQSRQFDFVGLFGSERVIQSAKLYGLGADEFFAVDGYAVSLVPEPSCLPLLGFGLGLLFCRRHDARN